MRITTTMILLFGFFVSCAFGAVPPIAWEPQPGEYYPKDARQFPDKIENPHPQIRAVAFTGKPLDVFTKLNMVTQIRFPEPPMMVNIGNPDAYVLDVAPEIAGLFVKPIAESEITNLIVTTASATYVIILKENPYKPFDAVVTIGDPYRQTNSNDYDVLIQMALSGQRHVSFQFDPMEIRTPNAETAVFEPVMKMAVKVVLKRAIVVPRKNAIVYWITLANMTDANVSTELKDYVVSEQSVNVPGLMGTAVMDGGTGLLKRGEAVDMFVFARGNALPDVLQMRFTLSGVRNLPCEVRLKTQHATGGNAKLETKKSLDDKIKEMYFKVEDKPITNVPVVSPENNNPAVPPVSSVQPVPQPQKPTEGGIVIFSK